MKQMQKKIRELESKIDDLSNQVNDELIEKDDNKQQINFIKKDIVETNDAITGLEIGEERNIRNIKVIKNEIQNLVDHTIEWDEKYQKLS
mgnify:CR=1 FL=1